jgi:hypothetical protein
VLHRVLIRLLDSRMFENWYSLKIHLTLLS